MFGLQVNNVFEKHKILKDHLAQSESKHRQECGRLYFALWPLTTKGLHLARLPLRQCNYGKQCGVDSFTSTC